MWRHGLAMKYFVRIGDGIRRGPSEETTASRPAPETLSPTRLPLARGF
jgi:hypothetical protein